ncbi:MAG: hypothetical protein QXY45_01155 [Candidatus Aenigmatarchaeota archaeon]
MKIPTKFRLNLEDYKIYFDNNKKTYICEDIETGEKTNIGVIGTFLQMGILKTIEDGNGTPDERISYLMDKVLSLEQRLSKLLEAKTQEIKPERKELFKIEEEEIPKIKKREPILKKVQKKDEDFDAELMEEILEKTIEDKPKNIKMETEEEIENWMEI